METIKILGVMSGGAAAGFALIASLPVLGPIGGVTTVGAAVGTFGGAILAGLEEIYKRWEK